jgi:hypothetical protein
VSGPAAAPTVAPPERADRKPRPWLALVAAVVLLLLGAGLLWFWPDEAPADAAPDKGAIGTAPASGNGSVGAAASNPNTQNTAVPGASTDAALPPQAPPDVRLGPLQVHTVVVRADALSYTLQVTVANVADATGSWHSIGLRLSGVNLAVTPAGSVVTYQFIAPAHCLVASGEIALAPGESLTIDVGVTALLAGALGGVQSARLDDAPCPT